MIFIVIMFGNSIDKALEISLLENTINDMEKTPKVISLGVNELNPVLRNFNPDKPGDYQLYGLLTSSLVIKLINEYVPSNYKMPAKVFANIIEAAASTTVGARWRLPLYAETF